MLDQLFLIEPRPAFEVMIAKCPDEQLRLVQPRGMHRREARPPPTRATRPVLPCGGCRVTGIAVLNQEHPLQAPMPATERPQLLDVVLRVLAGLDGHFHSTRMNDQEKQQVD